MLGANAFRAGRPLGDCGPVGCALARSIAMNGVALFGIEAPLMTRLADLTAAVINGSSAATIRRASEEVAAEPAFTAEGAIIKAQALGRAS